jgi:hypothetical protein
MVNNLLSKTLLIDHLKNHSDVSYLFFWGHQPSEKGIIAKSYLSQWYESSFTIESIDYRTAEHYMMAEKAKLFGDVQTFSEIVHAETPQQAKALGRKIMGFKEDIWVARRLEIVIAGNLAKFSQSRQLRDFLISTNGKVLVEASPTDAIWGIGLADNDKKATDPRQWPGLNLLGFALMTVRNVLNQGLING